jgi:hypothetical protein
VSVAGGTSRCPETALVYIPISQSLHSNSSTRYNIYKILLRMFHFRETYQSEEQTQFLLDATDVTTFFAFSLISVYVVELFVS